VVRDRTNRGGRHAQFAFGIDGGFVVIGKAHGHESSDGGYPLHAEARKKRGSARLAFQPCGFSTATRFWRCGPWQFGLSC
jgi:hypothetical protein